MKICLFPHPNTAKRFSALMSDFRSEIDIEICFPEENLKEKNADIFILEEELPMVTERLLSMETPPVIVIVKSGISNRQIRYLPDFTKQLPKLLDEINEHNPLLQLQQKNQRYFYHQKDILYLQKDKSVSIYFRQGTRIISKQSFQKITKQLDERIFFAVGSDVFVNAEYVSRLSADAVWLQNGQSILFPPEQSEQVKNAYFKTKYLCNLPT